MDLIKYDIKSQLDKNRDLTDFVCKLVSKFKIDQINHKKHIPKDILGFIQTYKYLRTHKS